MFKKCVQHSGKTASHSSLLGGIFHFACLITVDLFFNNMFQQGNFLFFLGPCIFPPWFCIFLLWLPPFSVPLEELLPVASWVHPLFTSLPHCDSNCSPNSPFFFSFFICFPSFYLLKQHTLVSSCLLSSNGTLSLK